MRPIFCVLTMAALCLSCQKEDTKPGDAVEIYLLKSYRIVSGKCQIDASTAVLHDAAIIKNEELLEYSQTNYEFTLTGAAIQRVKTFPDSFPFAVTVDKQVIYYGFFKPSYSSSSCDNSITMDVDRATGTKISLKLGYPGPLPGTGIDDRRNDPILIATLKNQGKLK
jgi:hypothetical protein